MPVRRHSPWAALPLLHLLGVQAACVTTDPNFDERRSSSESSTSDTRITDTTRDPSSNDDAGAAEGDDGPSATTGVVTESNKGGTTSAGDDGAEQNSNEVGNDTGDTTTSDSAGDSLESSTSTTDTDGDDGSDVSSSTESASGTGTDDSSGTDTDSGTETDTGTGTDSETGTETGEDPLPTQLILGDSELTAIINESAFDTSLRRCPAGSVAVAATGNLSNGGWLVNMQLQCAAISLSGVVDPALSQGEVSVLSVQGATDPTGGPWSLSCPPGKYLQGIMVETAPTVVARVFADCARLAWERDPIDSALTGQLVAEDLERVADSSSNSGESEGSAHCPEGYLAAGLITQHGVFISGMGLECKPWSTAP